MENCCRLIDVVLGTSNRDSKRHLRNVKLRKLTRENSCKETGYSELDHPLNAREFGSRRPKYLAGTNWPPWNNDWNSIVLFRHPTRCRRPFCPALMAFGAGHSVNALTDKLRSGDRNPFQPSGRASSCRLPNSNRRVEPRAIRTSHKVRQGKRRKGFLTVERVRCLPLPLSLKLSTGRL